MSLQRVDFFSYGASLNRDLLTLVIVYLNIV